MPLPTKVGSFTLMRKLAADAVAESFVAILDAPAGKQVVARRLLPTLARDAARVQAIRSRVEDLRALRPHPALAAVLGVHDHDGETWILEEQPDGVELSSAIAAASARGQPFPHDVFLHLAVQLCNALEAMHATTGVETGAEHVLHQALAPSSIWVTGSGHVTLGRFGLTRSPTAAGTQATGALPAAVEYLSPEQTHQDQKLSPASDLFSLGAILYELLTLKPLFRAESNLLTIHRLRRAEVTTQLLEVKEQLPGLDRVLFRALSLNARHRYQRAFVLREDLRGLMAGYSFSDIEPSSRRFLEPTLAAVAGLSSTVDGTTLGRDFHSGPVTDRTADVLRDVPDDDLRRSPLSEPRVEGPSLRPLAAPPVEEDDLSEGDTSGMHPVRAPRRDDTGWTPDGRRALAEHRPTTRPLTSIDTSRQHRDDLDPPAAPRAAPSRPERGDTLRIPIETTKPSDPEPDTAPTGPTGSPEPTGPTEPPTDAPAPPAPATAPPPKTDDLRSDDLLTASAEVLAVPSPPRPQPTAELRSRPPEPPAPVRPAPAPAAPPRPAPAASPAPAAPPATAAASATATARLTPPPLPPPPTVRTVVIDEPAPGPTGDEGTRSLLVPAAGLLAAVFAVGVAVLLCLGGGGALGLVRLRGQPGAPPSSETPVAAAAPAAPEPLPEPDPAPSEEPPAPVVAAAVPPPTPATPRQRDLGLDLSPPRPAPARETFEAVSAAPRTASPRTEAPRTEAPRTAAARTEAPRPTPPPAPPPRPAPAPPPDLELPPPPPEPPAPVAVTAADLDAWSTAAFAGELDPDRRSRIGEVPTDDPEFTRAQTLLLLDAKARRDDAARDRAMTTLMAVPENRYNPALLVEQAEISLERRQWASALEAARKAEQHWARLPSSLVWSRKALMYEVQALANTGRFYDSEGEDLSALQAAIRDWERYRRHVTTKDRADLTARADTNLSRLRDIEGRLAGGAP